MCTPAPSARKYPPAPRVEEEWDALSYEISDGPSSTGNGDDASVVSRGSIDQYPIILPAEFPETRPTLPDPNRYSAPSNIKAEKVKARADKKAADKRPSALSKRSQSETRPPNKVRFLEPLRDDRPRGRAGSDPSRVNYTRGQKFNANHVDKEYGTTADVSCDLSTNEAYREYRAPSTSKASSVKKDDRATLPRNTSRRPPPAYRYTGDFGNGPSDVDDLRQTNRRSSLHLPPRDRYGDVDTYVNPSNEWHSDDEISSSYRGTDGAHWKGSEFPHIAANYNHSPIFPGEIPPRRSRGTSIRSDSCSRSRLPLEEPQENNNEDHLSREYLPPNTQYLNDGDRPHLHGRHRSNSSPLRIPENNPDDVSQTEMARTRRNSPDSTSRSALELSAPTSHTTLQRHSTFPFTPNHTALRDSRRDCNTSNPPHTRHFNPPRFSSGLSTRPNGPFLPPPMRPAYESQQVNPLQLAPAQPEFRASSQALWPRSSAVPPRDITQRRPSGGAATYLSPCPRSIPMTGFHDWYTIVGLTHLDICPSCMSQIGLSRFRTLFIPSQPKPRDMKVRCSFSQPWARLAWVQTMKLRLNHLELLYQVTNPAGCRPCPGRTPSIRSWYRVSDPETGRTLPEFNACASCFRNLQILMPVLRDSFKSRPLVQERICDLRSDSTRFIQYLDLLDVAATRSRHQPQDHHPQPDMRDFVRYVKRKSTMYDCPRDYPVVGTWHYIAELPEFTVCEDCYDDVVWPLGISPVASLISRSPNLVPDTNRNPAHRHLASCQLYSPRMRTKFREAVRRADFSYLKAAVRTRVEAETAFRETKKMLLDDVARGYDRDAELRRNAEEWKRYE